MAHKDIQSAIKEFSGLSAEQTKRRILAQQNDGTGGFKEEDHPRDKDGKFTNKGGGSSGGSHKDAKQEELPAEEKKEEKPKRLQMSKQEYAVLRAEVMRKNAAQKGKVRPINFAYTANYFYVYSTPGGDTFTVLQQYDIEENRKKIDFVLGLWE